MWDTESKGNNAGFMNDSIVNEPSRVTNTVVSGGDERNKLTMPVSLSQIAKLTRPDEGLIIHGQKVSVVSVVAKIVEILDSSSHKLQYLIDDLTNGGPMEVQFIRSDAGLPGNDPGLAMFDENGMSTNPDENPTGQLRVDDYVRVYGLIRFASDKPQIMAYKIMPVLDPNEITMHILEVIRESMYALKCKSGDFGNKAGPSNLVQGTKIAGQDGNLNCGLANLPTLQKHVLGVVKRHCDQLAAQKMDTNIGISTAEIAAQLKHISRPEIETAVELLNQEGHLWNGNLEEHWCVS